MSGKVDQTVQTAKNFASATYISTCQKCRATADKTTAFVDDHKKEILFCACTMATAFFTPHLFVPIAMSTMLLRMYFTPKDPDSDQNGTYFTAIPLTLATISGVNALALGTVFFTNTLWVSACPMVLGALVAGDIGGKLAMDAYAKWFVKS